MYSISIQENNQTFVHLDNKYLNIEDNISYIGENEDLKNLDDLCDEILNVEPVINK